MLSGAAEALLAWGGPPVVTRGGERVAGPSETWLPGRMRGAGSCLHHYHRLCRPSTSPVTVNTDLEGFRMLKIKGTLASQNFGGSVLGEERVNI